MSSDDGFAWADRPPRRRRRRSQGSAKPDTRPAAAKPAATQPAQAGADGKVDDNTKGASKRSAAGKRKRRKRKPANAQQSSRPQRDKTKRAKTKRDKTKRDKVQPDKTETRPRKRSTTKKSIAPPPISSGAPAGADEAEALRARIRELEAQLEATTSQDAAAPPSTRRKPLSEAPVSERGGPGRATRDLLRSKYFTRQWGRRSMQRARRRDDFGLDTAFEKRLQPVLDFLSSVYFRMDVRGIEHVPSEGRCLLVANHSGGPIPLDGVMLRTALRREHPSARCMRWLSEDLLYHLPFVGTTLARLGAVRACQDNAKRLLSDGSLLAVFPEGAKGIGKLHSERYKLQRFGRGGFIRLCIRTGTPLVPCALVGAEDANPMLYKLEYMVRHLGVPYLPVTPTFPLLGPLGLLPAPTKWLLRFGPITRFDEYPPEAADDAVLVRRLSDRVRSVIQGMLDETVRSRRSVFFG